MTHVDHRSSAVEWERARGKWTGLRPRRHKPATAQSCLIQAENRLELVCVSRGVACDAAHSDSDRPSLSICPSVAAARLTDDGTTSRAADQHFPLPNLTPPASLARDSDMHCLF